MNYSIIIDPPIFKRPSDPDLANYQDILTTFSDPKLLAIIDQDETRHQLSYSIKQTFIEITYISAVVALSNQRMSDTQFPIIQGILDSTNQTNIIDFNSLFQKIEDCYHFKSKSRVKEFIEEHSYLTHILIESYELIIRFFGSGCYLELAVTTDPEEGFKELFVYIKTALPVDEALQKLDNFDDQWFLDKMSDTKGKLNFNLSFE